MSSGKEIKGKIRSVKDTQKITSAMEMVAASKMRKAQERMRASRPYAQSLAKMIANVSAAQPDYQHPFVMCAESVNCVGMIIVSTDRGLCGGLNNNLFRLAINQIESHQKAGRSVRLFLYGSKAELFFPQFNVDIAGATASLGDRPCLEDIQGNIDLVFSQYFEKKIQKLYVLSNHFVSGVSQKPECSQVLPTDALKNKDLSKHGVWDYIYEPSPQNVLDVLMRQYVEHVIYHAVIENIACEQSSRMLAMRNASDNAGDIISDLSLAYNKTRQAAITQELAEIVSGADAIS